MGGSSGIIGGHQNNPRAKSGISNATIRSLQGDTVLLVNDPVTLQSISPRSGEIVEVCILMANWSFGGFPVWSEDPELSWATAVVGGSSLSNTTVRVPRGSVPQGETGPIAVGGENLTVRITVPHVELASKLVIEVALRVSGITVATNHWDLSIFPALAAKPCPVPVFTDQKLLKDARRVCSNAALVPPSLGPLRTGPPFVLLHQGGLTEQDAAVIRRAGGFALLLNPAESWPVCNQSALGPVKVKTVRYFQPWWMNPGLAGTLVYNTSFTESFGSIVDSRFLDYSWASVVDQAQAYTLDDLVVGTAKSIHVRAIPAFSTTPNGGTFATAVTNDALIWEGQITADDVGGGATHDAGGRFLVSGLNLFNSTRLKAEPVAEFVFSKLLSYAVSETAAAAAIGEVNPPTPRTEPRSFCTVGSEQACQLKTVAAGIGNANFEIVTEVRLEHDATVDALHPRLSSRGHTASVVPVIYDTAPAANASSFCSATTGHGASWPRELVAKGPATELVVAQNASWVRMPLSAPTLLKAGTYWVGLLLSADVNCFAVPGGSTDAYASRSFAAGAGPELSFQMGSSNFAVYASTST